MLRNIAGLISKRSEGRLRKEVARNVQQLFALGREHFLFAKATSAGAWRQKASRFYYGAYTISRAVRLAFDGSFHMDVTDHKEIGKLPDGFPNKDTYASQLLVLREDRNLADYSHQADVADLVIPLRDVEKLLETFIGDAQAFLRARGVRV